MRTEKSKEIIYTISDYYELTNSITIRLVDLDGYRYVMFESPELSNSLNLPNIMVDDLMKALEQAGVFLRQDPP